MKTNEKENHEIQVYKPLSTTLIACTTDTAEGQMSITGKNVLDYLKAEKEVSLPIILTQDPKVKLPVLKQLVDEDPSSVLKSIVVIVKHYALQLNVYRELGAAQYTAIATDLTEHFKDDTLEDVLLLFKYARLGYFGYYARLDISVITQWIPQYKEIKAEAREKKIRDQQGRAVGAEIDDERLVNFYVKHMNNKRRQGSRISQRGIKRIPANSPLADSTQLQRSIEKQLPSLTVQELRKNWEKTRVNQPDIAKLFLDELNRRSLKKKVPTLEEAVAAQHAAKQSKQEPPKK